MTGDPQTSSGSRRCKERENSQGRRREERDGGLGNIGVLFTEAGDSDGPQKLKSKIHLFGSATS